MANKNKESFVSELTEELKKSPHIVVTDYQGMKADEFNELRNSLNKVGAKYKVVKNRLARLAFKSIGWESLSDDMKGPSAIAYFGTDGAALNKILQEFSSKHQNLKVKAGHVFGAKATGAELKMISKLPSREVLLATLLSRLTSPLKPLLATLNEPIRSLHGALSAIAKKKESVP